MQTIVKRILDIPAALSATLGRIDARALKRSLADRPLLVVIGSGNSAYPACYLEYLLARASTIACRQMTPLEYALRPPRQDHVCLLVSKGARRGDSVSVAALSERYHAPLFVVCDQTALSGDTVAAQLTDAHGPNRVFPFVSGNERGFVSIIGTAVAFAICHELAAALGAGVPSGFPVGDFATLASEADGYPRPSHPSCVVLHGPAGKAAAEAFAGYHAETLGPMMICDMKNFTHGVWRGLHDAGPHTVYLIADRAVAPLVDYLQPRLSADHECVVVSAPAEAWSVEPFELFLRILYRWVRHCLVRADERKAQGVSWSPLSMNPRAYSAYMGLHTDIDLTDLLAADG